MSIFPTDDGRHDGDQVVHAAHVGLDREALLLRRDAQGPARRLVHAAGALRGGPAPVARRHGRQRAGNARLQPQDPRAARK